MSTTWLMVRAVVGDTADIPRFDAGTRRSTCPMRSGRLARCARRCWSGTDARVHCAFYEFPDAATAAAALASPALRALVAEFDRVWGTSVTRTRELLELAGEL